MGPSCLMAMARALRSLEDRLSTVLDPKAIRQHRRHQRLLVSLRYNTTATNAIGDASMIRRTFIPRNQNLLRLQSQYVRRRDRWHIQVIHHHCRCINLIILAGLRSQMDREQAHRQRLCTCLHIIKIITPLINHTMQAVHNQVQASQLVALQLRCGTALRRLLVLLTLLAQVQRLFMSSNRHCLTDCHHLADHHLTTRNMVNHPSAHPRTLRQMGHHRYSIAQAVVPSRLQQQA